MTDAAAMREETRAIMAGHLPDNAIETPNPPVYRASTIGHPRLANWRQRDPKLGYVYGRYGTPTQRAFEAAVAGLEGGDSAFATSSGLAAITTALTAFVGTGDHILVTDSVYGPVRAFCNGVLARFGVETTYYDPLIGARIEVLMRKTTRVVYTESPGSNTFEVQDLPALSRAAHAGGAVVVNDGTWATPVGQSPFDLGVDVSIHAATKYIAGHSDALLGVIVTRAQHERTLRDAVGRWGQHATADDCYLALRGLRTLPLRLERHARNAHGVAEWLRTQPAVRRVLYPPLSDDPGHALWRRDFRGASGLLGLVLDRHYDDDALGAMLDHFDCFRIGASWGGFESLVLPMDDGRSLTTLPIEGTLLRLHIGLEHPDDLIADLERGFDRLRNCRTTSSRTLFAKQD